MECGICKNKHRKHTGPWRTVPMHTIPRRVQELFGARPHHLYTTDRDTIENAWSTGSPVDSLTKRTGIRKAKVPLVHENRRLPSPRFSSLSLSVFSPFHFHFDKQELDDKAEAYIKTRNGTVRIDDIRAMGRRLIFTTLFPLYDSYSYFT